VESVYIILPLMMCLDPGDVISFASSQKTYPIMKLDRQLAWIVLISQ